MSHFLALLDNMSAQDKSAVEPGMEEMLRGVNTLGLGATSEAPTQTYPYTPTQLRQSLQTQELPLSKVSPNQPPTISMTSAQRTHIAMDASMYSGSRPSKPATHARRQRRSTRDQTSVLNERGFKILRDWIKRGNLKVYPCWVGNLPSGTTVEQLRVFFESAVGPCIVSVHVLQNDDGTCFAFVNLPNEESRLLASIKLNEAYAGTQQISIRQRRATKLPHTLFGFPTITSDFKVLHEKLLPDYSGDDAVVTQVGIQALLMKHNIDIENLPHKMYTEKCNNNPCNRSYCSFYHNETEHLIGINIQALRNSDVAPGPDHDEIEANSEDVTSDLSRDSDSPSINRNNVFFKGVDRRVSGDKFVEILRSFGVISATSDSSEACFVRFERAEDAQKVIHIFRNQPGLTVRLATYDISPSDVLSSSAYQMSSPHLQLSTLSTAAQLQARFSRPRPLTPPHAARSAASAHLRLTDRKSDPLHSRRHVPAYYGMMTHRRNASQPLHYTRAEQFGQFGSIFAPAMPSVQSDDRLARYTRDKKGWWTGTSSMLSSHTSASMQTPKISEYAPSSTTTPVSMHAGSPSAARVDAPSISVTSDLHTYPNRFAVHPRYNTRMSPSVPSTMPVSVSVSPSMSIPSIAGSAVGSSVSVVGSLKPPSMNQSIRKRDSSSNTPEIPQISSQGRPGFDQYHSY
jgi:RNA recognition motif-containing protein